MQATTIEWADRTWNPVTGCTKVSQGCKNCYAERFYERFNGHGTFKFIHLHRERLSAPVGWKKPSMIFVNSMSDLFHESVPFDFIYRVILIMTQDAPWHIYQILTKRPDTAVAFFKWLRTTRNISLERWPRIWIGVSVEDQKTADERIPLLMEIPAAVRFLSCEPLLGPVDIDSFKYHFGSIGPLCESCSGNGYYKDNFHTPCPHCKTTGGNPWAIHWVICGGESGPGARPMHPDWVRLIRDKCEKHSIPFFFKQWGAWLPFEQDAQPPFYNCSANGANFDGHGMNFMDSNADAGKWNGGTWMDGFEAQLYCAATNNNPVMFLRRNKKKNGNLLDAIVHKNYPNLKF